MTERVKILIAYDGSDYALAAINDLRRAGGLPPRAEALVVSVADVLIPPRPISSEEITKIVASRRVASTLMQAHVQASQATSEAMRLASEGCQHVQAIFPGWSVREEVLGGTPEREIIQKAEDWEADLIVVGTQGRTTLGRILLGSISQKVAAEAVCSVRVGRENTKDDARPLRLLVGVDDSDGSRSAVKALAGRFWPAGSEARVISIIRQNSLTGVAGLLPNAEGLIDGDGESETMIEAREAIESAVEELCAADGLDVSAEMITGDPQRVLLGKAEEWEADCIFVGSKGQTNSFERFWLGSVSRALVIGARCSVEVVRPKQTPVA